MIDSIGSRAYSNIKNQGACMYRILLEVFICLMYVETDNGYDGSKISILY